MVSELHPLEGPIAALGHMANQLRRINQSSNVLFLLHGARHSRYRMTIVMAVRLQSLGSKQIEGAFENMGLNYSIKTHEVFYMVSQRYSIDAKRDLKSVLVRAPYC